MRKREGLVEKKKAVSSEYKAQIDDVDAQIKQCLNAASSGRRDLEITVEEWLTDKNQVERYRTDTGERIGDRVARIDELQEKLPLEEPDDEDETDDGEEGDDADRDAHVDAAMAAAIADQTGEPTDDSDFGEA